MNVNAYLAKQYDSPPCWQLVADVYTSELAQPVTDYKTINASIRAIASAFRIALHKSPEGFAQIVAPVDYCIVLMGRTATMGLHHCGVFYQGRVLHALDAGNRYEEMSVIGDAYAVIEFWARAT
jgi:hypothetical protein